jgi:hypothetical protein
VNAEVRKFAAEEGILIETTAPYSPSQNGIAERFNRSVIELVRAMLIAKNLPAFLWDEAVSHVVYLRNRAPTQALKGMTPYEAWNGLKPDVSHFREFGCDVWVLDEDKNRSKLALKSKKMVFVGFAEGSKAVHYWDKATRKIKVSRNVAFNENDEPTSEMVSLPGVPAEGEIIIDPAETPATDAPKPSIPQPNTPTQDDSRNLRDKPKINYRQLNNPSSRQPSGKITIRIPPKLSSTPATPPDISRPTESSKAKTIEKANLAAEILEQDYAFQAIATDDPKTYEEAMEGEERENWKAAMDEEIGTLRQMGTWELQELPAERKPIGCKWVFLKKRDEFGQVTRYKARLVAQGFSQKPGTDFSNDGTFAP